MEVPNLYPAVLHPAIPGDRAHPVSHVGRGMGRCAAGPLVCSSAGVIVAVWWWSAKAVSPSSMMMMMVET